MIDHMDQNTMVLISKKDLGIVIDLEKRPKNIIGSWPVSVKNGDGLNEFISAFENEVGKRMELTDAPSLTRTRHRQLLQNALGHMSRYLEGGHFELELLSEDLRMAARDIGKVTGYVDVEDILEKIFTEFCIGK